MSLLGFKANGEVPIRLERNVWDCPQRRSDFSVPSLSALRRALDRDAAENTVEEYVVLHDGDELTVWRE